VRWLDADVVEMARCAMTGVDMIGVVKHARTQELIEVSTVNILHSRATSESQPNIRVDDIL
jgi:hypothetical protein